jgi:quercetin dioxygenase-like cupin family protein
MSTDRRIAVQPKLQFEISGIYTAVNKKCEAGFVFTGESHPFWELLYVKNGMVEVIEDEKTYVLYEGDLICHAPNEFHRIKSAGGTTPRIYVLTLLHSGILPEGKIYNLYIPKIAGKEHRKRKASASGNLGVEGMEKDVIVNLLKPFSNGEFEVKIKFLVTI